MKDTRINSDIRAVEVRVISEDGQMHGVMGLREALELADREGLDLVEISPDAKPPVCKIMDYSKYRYELQKKKKMAKKNQKKVDTKEIKLSPRIASGDYNIKLRRARAFIEEGHKVRVSLYFRGREITHNEVGYNVVNQFKDDITDIATVELMPKMEGRQILMILAPMAGSAPKKPVHGEESPKSSDES